MLNIGIVVSVLNYSEEMFIIFYGKDGKFELLSKKTKKNPEEKQYFFPNTHEALIDEETFFLYV